MENLRKTINDLITKLETSPPLAGSVEATTLGYLRTIATAAHHTEKADDLTPFFSDLRAHWLASINWCSPLSKDVEKLLIIQEESLDLTNDDPGGTP